MKIEFSEISTPATGVIAVGVTDDRTLGATARALDEQSGGVLSRALASGRFSGKKGTSTTIVAPHGLEVDAVILVGLGQPGKIDGRQLRALGGSVVGKANAAGARRLQSRWTRSRARTWHRPRWLRKSLSARAWAVTASTSTTQEEG